MSTYRSAAAIKTSTPAVIFRETDISPLPVIFFSLTVNPLLAEPSPSCVAPIPTLKVPARLHSRFMLLLRDNESVIFPIPLILISPSGRSANESSERDCVVFTLQSPLRPREILPSCAWCPMCILDREACISAPPMDTFIRSVPFL